MKSSNSNIIFIDDSKTTSTEFKNKLRELIKRILESEEIIFYLRDINIYFVDSGMLPNTLDRLIRERKYFPHPVYNPRRKGIVLNADEWFMFYNFIGIEPLNKYLSSILTHELIHYLHYSVNKNLEKVLAAQLRLEARYKKKYKQFETSLVGPGLVLQFLNVFIDKCISEGFAQFFEKFKHETITFTQESFTIYYDEAIKAAQILSKEIHKLKKVNKRNLKKMGYEFTAFFMGKGGENHWYDIGFHIIYSIIYLHPDTLEKDFKFLLHKFQSSFGRLKPRKLIDTYDDLMRTNNLEPILTFKHSGGYINCREVSREWKRIFK